MKPLIYVAGPISLPDPLENISRAIKICHEIMEEGYAVPFCPHLSCLHQMIAPRSWQEWLDYDKDVISHCHAVYRLSGDSKGADIEEDFALSGRDGAGFIPVFYEWERDEMNLWAYGWNLANENVKVDARV